MEQLLRTMKIIAAGLLVCLVMLFFVVVGGLLDGSVWFVVGFYGFWIGVIITVVGLCSKGRAPDDEGQ